MIYENPFYPTIRVDQTCSIGTMNRMKEMLSGAPGSYAGKQSAIAISRIFAVTSGLQGTNLTPVMSCSIHRYYPDDIAGETLFDELSPQEQDHFAPALRLMMTHHVSAQDVDKAAPGFLRRYIGRNIILAYLNGVLIIFPQRLDEALNGVNSREITGASAKESIVGAICTILVPQPASSHAKLAASDNIEAIWPHVEGILKGYSGLHAESMGFRLGPYSLDYFISQTRNW